MEKTYEKECESRVTFIEFGENGKGKIEAGPKQQERLGEFTDRVGGGEFHVALSDDAPKIVCSCVDGRTPENGAQPLAPNAAGGTESLFVAET